jgi:hypothetical protein
MVSPRFIALLGVALFFGQFALASPDALPLSRIKRQPVASSNVASIGYSRSLHALEIEFTRGAIYRFYEVPREVYRELLTADSKGHFIAEKLRGKYRFTRVRASRRASSPVTRSN